MRTRALAGLTSTSLSRRIPVTRAWEQRHTGTPYRALSFLTSPDAKGTHAFVGGFARALFSTAVSPVSSVAAVTAWATRPVEEGGVGLDADDAGILQREKIDGMSLFSMTDAKLEKCGMVMGPRHKLLAAIARLLDIRGKEPSACGSTTFLVHCQYQPMSISGIIKTLYRNIDRVGAFSSASFDRTLREGRNWRRAHAGGLTTIGPLLPGTAAV
jgi:hypothetical protein